METKDREIARVFAGKGISWNDLSEAKKELARKVYAVVKPKLDKLQELTSQIEDLKFNKVSLADELHINRKTLGSNNPEIAVLIATLMEQEKTMRPKMKPSSDLKAQNEALREQINKLLERDVEKVRLYHDNLELKKKLELEQRQKDYYKKQIEELKANPELEEYAKTVTSFGGNKKTKS